MTIIQIKLATCKYKVQQKNKIKKREKILKILNIFIYKKNGITINQWMKDNDQDETTVALENLTH